MNLNKLYGHLNIDGQDAYSEYGFIILKGSMNDWLLFPEMKEPFSHNWKDENGLDVDLENRYLKDKNVSLKVLFVADSEMAFWSNYKKTLNMLTQPGIRKVYYREMEKEFEVYYTKSSSPSTFTRLKDVNKVVVGMTLHFSMPDPSVIVERLVAPESIGLVVGEIIGVGAFSYNVWPEGSSRAIRTVITPLTGDAFVLAETIYATRAGSIKIRIASAVNENVYDERTIQVYPQNIVHFADNSMLDDGFEYITVF